ncbi:MAG: beta-glucuronidase [Phycisphaerales bacterium]
MTSLYPIDSETREAKPLDGLWEFKIDVAGRGLTEHWERSPLRDASPMPVPSSYNDLSTGAADRDHVGDVWYQRGFFVPASWQGDQISLRFGSVTHHASVWLNGAHVGDHRGGFLPFELDVTTNVRFGQANHVTVRVDNTLNWTSLPPGEISEQPDPTHPAGKRLKQNYHFDFFNYAGIHRPAYLVRKPKQHIRDITVTTGRDGSVGRVRYEIDTSVPPSSASVSLYDEQGRVVASATGRAGELNVPDVKLWRPGKAYLYELQANVVFEDGANDTYRLPIGVRTVEVRGNQFLINGEPFYFRGFGKHEDADLRGRGMDHVTNVRDFNLLKWIGANSFRTSHYPYSEEIMRLADREGIVIIDEVPAVGMFLFGGHPPNTPVFCDDRVNDKTLAHHLDVMRDLIARDKNHPCVVMWSVANEANTSEDAAVPYFTRVADETRRMDPTRPIAIVTFRPADRAKVEHLFDVIGVNRYKAWYENPGELDTIGPDLERDLRQFHELFGKPILVAEFGADTIHGFHSEPPTMFSEEYQAEYLRRSAAVFDRLDFVIGEHVWNFADFATKQGVTRVMGNRKGIFTRQRQPKMAAHVLRERWTKLKK